MEQKMADFLFAYKLQCQFNGTVYDENEALAFANSYANREIGGVGQVGAGRAGRSRSNSPVRFPLNRPRSPYQMAGSSTHVTVENQQAMTIKKEKTSPNDYYLPSFHTYIDLNNNQEWAMVNMESNIQQMFDKLKEFFWESSLDMANFEVKWDKTAIISSDSVFKIFEDERQVLISASAMIKPRIQLVSIILHVLIHIYLKTCSKGAISMNVHDDNFREIMLIFNSKLNTKISAFHKIPYSPEELNFPNQWYQCTGICQNYEPFHGSVHCISVPSESQAFWKGHEFACGGQFFKVFEMSRTNPETLHEEKAYIRNVRYMFPKPRQADSKSKDHLKTNIQARELFDLTDDNEEAAKVQNLCEVIDLDDTEYNLPSTTATTMTHGFVKQIHSFNSCPFCKTPTGASQFSSHVDSCRGYQQKVVFSAAAAAKFTKH